MKALLFGASVGWISTSIGFFAIGRFNSGSAFPGLMILFGWAFYFAFRRPAA